MRKIELVEYSPAYLASDELSQEEAYKIYEQYEKNGGRLTIDFPSFKNRYTWRIQSNGWVGHLPVDSKLIIIIKPRISLTNLFQLLEYAYKISPGNFAFLDGITKCDSLDGFYGGIARLLAFRILEKKRDGLYRCYVSSCKKLPYIRGNLQLNNLLLNPFELKFLCKYKENTADNEDNQILLWTLYCIARCPTCPDHVLPIVRKAYLTVSRIVSLKSYYSLSCKGRFYNRLNQSYRALHALCKFFLDNIGPSHNTGDHPMVPFLIKMPNLFELFVSEWISCHLPKRFTVKYLERFKTAGDGFGIEIDLVIYDKEGAAVCVIDTKYKNECIKPDVNQVHTYAGAKACRYAFLVYPEKVKNPIDTVVGKIRIKTIVFSIGEDIEESGREFLSEVVQTISE